MIRFLFILTLSTAVFANDDLAKQYRKMLHYSMKPLTVDKDFMEKHKDSIDLGRKLFYDKSLSKNNQSSCNDCHDLNKYGTNGDYALKLREQGKLFRDVPSIYNNKTLHMFNWDARFKKLSEKVSHSLLSEHEMANGDKESLVKRLQADKAYPPLFAKAFPKDKLNYDNIVKAIVHFQHGLVTPSAFDKFLSGDNKAMTEKELKGAIVFDKHNCASCHTGINFGGQMLQKMGTIIEWPNQKDKGYFHLTGKADHKMVFRVAPLRNMMMTRPYFHDGTSTRAWDAIRKMGKHELGTMISVEDVLSIQEFLKTLTGEIPKAYIKKPE